MNQRVPSWGIDDPPHLLSPSSSVHPQLLLSDYEVAELTWENGQVSAHGLVKPTPRYPRSAAGTLECLIDQAKLLPSDALVPTQGEDLASGIGSCDNSSRRKKARLGDCTSRDDTWGATSVTLGDGSSRNTTVFDDHDSVCHSPRSKRTIIAAVHNKTEKERRDRINEKMRTLQRMVPNSSKTDKASMLEEVIEYLKLLQAQVQMMRGMGGMHPMMMMPMSMQQFQMTMMAQMAQMAQMGMGMGMMDMASLGRVGPTGISPVIPISTGVTMPDLFSAFLAGPSQQQVTTDTYQRMAALYPQMFQPTNPK